MLIRNLTDRDAAAFRELRIRGLREHPEAFLIAPEEEADVAELARRFREDWKGTEAAILGAFLDGALAGLCAWQREKPAKYRHMERFSRSGTARPWTRRLT